MVKNSNKNKSLTPLKLASYGTAKVYKTNQIKLNADLLTTLGIKSGDRVKVFLDTEERAIVIKSKEENSDIQSGEQMDK